MDPNTLTVTNQTVLKAVTIWFALAILASALGMLRLFPPPFPQLCLVALTAITVYLMTVPLKLRHYFRTVNIQALIAIHISRFVGFYFLWLYDSGLLPYEFAVLGGWGDICVATAALLVVILISRGVKISGKIILGWNTLGLLDITFVVMTAARLALADPESMKLITVLPLSLLPLFLVPIIIATHLLIFLRHWSRS